MEHLQLLDALRTGKKVPEGPVFVFVGPERYLMRVAEERLVAYLGLSGRRVLWADETEEATLLQELTSPSLFGGAPLFVLQRAEALKSLDTLLASPHLPPVVLEVHDDLKAYRQWLRGRGLKRVQPQALARALDKKYKGKLTAVAFPELGRGSQREREARAFHHWIQSELKRLGAPARLEILRFLSAYLPRDLTAASQELQKVALYLAAQPQATTAEVQRLLGTRSTFNVFNLTGALISGDIKRFIAEFRELQKTGESPQGILSLLEHTLLDLILVKAGLPVDRPKFVLERYRSFTRVLTLGDLFRLLQRVRDTEIRLRSRSVNAPVAVETLFFDLLWWRTASSSPSSR